MSFISFNHMSDTRTAIEQSLVEPNWLFVQQHSWLEQGRDGFVAFMDRYARKAAENYEMFGDGVPDPDYGKDPVYLGPYFPDQSPMGRLRFHGPKILLPGPEEDWYSFIPDHTVTGGYTEGP